MAVLTWDLQGRKYLNYDMAAVREFVATQKGCERVFVAIQDSEAFDSALLADLIQVFRYPIFPSHHLQRPSTDYENSTWWPEIPYILLFGVATSVDLLQNRLPKSACEHLHGAQFDVAQGSTALEQVIVRAAVAAHDVPLRIGPSLLDSLMNRQRDQVAGIQAFISSLKVSSVPWSPSPL